MDKRSVYVDLAQEYVNLLEETNSSNCCYNYDNDEQVNNRCEEKDCDECRKQFYDEVYDNYLKKYDDAK